MKLARFWLLVGVLALTTAYSSATIATTLAELQASGHLHIDSEITPGTGIVPGQRVKLTGPDPLQLTLNPVAKH